MNTIAAYWKRSLCLLHTRIFALALVAAAGSLLFSPAGAAAQAQPAARIHAEISSSQMTMLPNSKHPLALAKYDAGRVSGATKLEGMSIHFSRTAAQEANLQALLAAQQNPASPQYHQWLTPDQFAAQFGVADSDIAKVKSWLQQEGFSVDWVARSKNMLRFSGTISQAEQAFSTELHTYNIPTSKGIEKHFAPSTALSVPAALSGIVERVGGLDDFRPKSHLKPYPLSAVHPNYTDGSGNHELVPGDIYTIYDLNALYNAGITGTGQTIAIVGQSDVDLSDVAAFRSAAGLTASTPTKILVPSSGAPYISSGDESESDLDLEWSGAIAKSATIDFVYVGDSTNTSTFDAIAYAIDQRIAPIISSSYGDCEIDVGSGILESNLEQAAAQGQTVISASGDDGSTDCASNQDLSVSEEGSLSVDYPASSPYVTGVGGTQFSGDASSSGSYWGSSSATGGASAASYIPETAWNEDSSTNGLGASGGGPSELFTKPSWQTGTGVPTTNARYVPDLALDAAYLHDPYLYCSSDIASTGVTGSCSNGFLDSSSKNLTTAGGTSFAAPIFAGMLALINQKQNSTGQGLINPTLYTLAANSTVYGSAFHDITTGNNDCSAGSNFCLESGSSSGYSAGTGYDPVTGLGTIDANNLATAWPATATGTAPTLLGSTTTVTASSSTPALSQSITFTVTVAAIAGGGIPTGTVSFTLDGNVVNSATLNGGTATYSAAFTSAGNHVIEASYSGDSTYAASVGTASVNVLSNAGSFSFTPASTSLTISSSTTCTNSALVGYKYSTACDVLTVTPTGGYTGTIDFQATTTDATLASEGCYNWDSAGVTGSSTGTGTIYISVNSDFCSSYGIPVTGGVRANRRFKLVPKTQPSPNSGSTRQAGIWAVSLLIAALIGFRVRRLRSAATVLFLIGIGLGLSACGGGSSSSGTGTTSTGGSGGVSVVVTGTDEVSPSITSTTTISVAVQ